MSRINARFALRLTLICWTAAAVVPASAQYFQQIPGTLQHIAAGRTEVWGLNYEVPVPGGASIYRYNPSSQSFVLIAGGLGQIAVGGGTPLQPDQVWGVNEWGDIYQYNFSSNVFVQMPGVAEQIAVGVGGSDVCHPFEVWAISTNQYIYRWNYEVVPACGPAGWVQIANPYPFSQIVTGDSDIWALDIIDRIWHYNLVTQGWTQIGGGCNNTLTEIAVGVNDVWGAGCNGTIYRSNPFQGGDFVAVAAGTWIAAGGNGVWGIDAGDVVHFTSGPPAYFLGLQPMTMAVGTGGGTWLINGSDQVYVFVP